MDVEVQGAGQSRPMRFGAHFPWVQALACSWGKGWAFWALVGGNGLVRQEVFREMSIHDEWALESEFGLSYESWIDRWEEKA